MDKLKVDFDNCYGIEKLEHTFDFSSGSSFIVYAPNGMMKSSFAKTFQDFSYGIETKDRVYDETTSRKILDENDNPIPEKAVFVIEPYNKDYESEQISNLLVNSKLKEQYDFIYQGIESQQEILVKALKKYSKVKDVALCLSLDITHESNSFLKALLRLKAELPDDRMSIFRDIVYQDIFNDKVMAKLKRPELMEKIKDYINNYDTLISSSTFFKKGIFNHNDASTIAKNLENNGFFKANHSVNIHIGKEIKTINNSKDLIDAIETEKKRILEDPKLKEIFEKVDKEFIGNIELKTFRDLLLKNQFLLIELDNLELLKEHLWKAYLTEQKELYFQVIDLYKESQTKLEEIIVQAQKEKTKWQEVLEIFNKRFYVPFEVMIDNKEDVILRKEVPHLTFCFNTKGRKTIEKDRLIQVLSNGEKRALYLLNIIFEIEARKEAHQDTLFIIDDIADSFDYKNKYAIVEYLHELDENPLFKQIILTHNFDFYRTLSSRLNIPERTHKNHAFRINNIIKIKEEVYQKNPFLYWKNHWDKTRFLLASIPFIRNLAEYIGDHESEEKLSNILHMKSGTESFLVADLQKIIRNVFKDQQNTILLDNDKNLFELLIKEANLISQETDEYMELDKKIILSMAIRLTLERFLISQINDNEFLQNITSNQTFTLIKKYNSIFQDSEYKELMDQVQLMTPENIHINSFMYEPILDMSNEHLKKLYQDVSKLPI